MSTASPRSRRTRAIIRAISAVDPCLLAALTNTVISLPSLARTVCVVDPLTNISTVDAVGRPGLGAKVPAALAGGVPPLEDHHDAGAFCAYPFLELDQLCLQAEELLLVGAPRQQLCARRWILA